MRRNTKKVIAKPLVVIAPPIVPVYSESEEDDDRAVNNDAGDVDPGDRQNTEPATEATVNNAGDRQNIEPVAEATVNNAEGDEALRTGFLQPLVVPTGVEDVDDLKVMFDSFVDHKDDLVPFLFELLCAVAVCHLLENVGTQKEKELHDIAYAKLQDGLANLPSSSTFKSLFNLLPNRSWPPALFEYCKGKKDKDTGTYKQSSTDIGGWVFTTGKKARSMIMMYCAHHWVPLKSGQSITGLLQAIRTAQRLPEASDKASRSIASKVNRLKKEKGIVLFVDEESRRLAIEEKTEENLAKMSAKWYPSYWLVFLFLGAPSAAPHDAFIDRPILDGVPPVDLIREAKSRAVRRAEALAASNNGEGPKATATAAAKRTLDVRIIMTNPEVSYSYRDQLQGQIKALQELLNILTAGNQPYEAETQVQINRSTVNLARLHLAVNLARLHLDLAVCINDDVEAGNVRRVEPRVAYETPGTGMGSSNIFT
jgi:hypothetical protein